MTGKAGRNSKPTARIPRDRQVVARARATLREAVKSVERTLVPTTNGHFTGRSGGLCGEWDVLADFQVGGRRYVVATEAARGLRPSARILTEAERSVVAAAATGASTKEIAHTLGLVDTTVRVLLMRAARRYRVRTRQELVRLWMAQEVLQ